jgi:hypothetical protein
VEGRPLPSRRTNILVTIGAIGAVWVAYNIKYSMQLDARVKFWEKEMADEIPVGSSAEKIQQWGKAKDLRFFELIKSQNAFSTNVEVVRGIGLICPDWNIIIRIEMGSDNRSEKQNVHTVGSCI